MTCMVELQGFKREDIVADRFGTLDTIRTWKHW